VGRAKGKRRSARDFAAVVGRRVVARLVLISDHHVARWILPFASYKYTSHISILDGIHHQKREIGGEVGRRTFISGEHLGGVGAPVEGCLGGQLSWKPSI